MKFAVRAFTMLVVFAGLATASVGSAHTKTAASGNFMAPGPMGMPIPECGPGIPGCPQPPHRSSGTQLF